MSEYSVDHLQEIVSLRARVAALEHDLAVQRALLEGEAAELDRLRRLEFRVKDGRLTEEEFQTLCHNLGPEDEARFKRGCYNEWRRLFGNADPPPEEKGADRGRGSGGA